MTSTLESGERRLPSLEDAQRIGAAARDLRDVDKDGFIAPIDALLVINYLNAPTRDENLLADPLVGGIAGSFYDVSGDNLVTAIDALLVLNRLNRLSNNIAAGEGESAPLDGYFADLAQQPEAHGNASPSYSTKLADVVALLATDSSERIHKRANTADAAIPAPCRSQDEEDSFWRNY